MSYQVLQRVTGRRETRRVDLPIVPWGGQKYNCLACGSKSGQSFILRTEDHGETWPILQTFPFGLRALTKTGEGRYIALVPSISSSPPFGSAIVYTEDGWETWAEVEKIWWDETLWTAAADGSGVVLMAGGGPVYRSTDYGLSWDEGTSEIGDAVFYAGEGMFFAAAQGNLYKSTDGGATWDEGTPMREWYDEWNWYDLTARDVKAFGDTVLVAAYNGSSTAKILRSTDRGATYTMIDAFELSPSISAIEPLGDGVVLAVADDFSHVDVGMWRLYKSTDGGATWETRGLFPGAHRYAMAMRHLGEGVVVISDAAYAYLDGRLHRRLDGGWTPGSVIGDIGVINSFALI